MSKGIKQTIGNNFFAVIALLSGFVLQAATPEEIAAYYESRIINPENIEEISSLPQPEARIRSLSNSSFTQALTGLGSDAVLDKLSIRADIPTETTGLLGDNISLNTGVLGFSHTDVNIPGNFPIEVAIRRAFRGHRFKWAATLEFEDWSLDIPHISTTYLNGNGFANTWKAGHECSGDLSPGPVHAPIKGVVEEEAYWAGVNLSVPGKTNEKLLENREQSSIANDDFPRVTKSNWRISCFNRTDGMGEGFKAHSPDGLIYTFSELNIVQTGAVLSDERKPFGKYQAYMLVTKVEDKFGNYVNYNYVPRGAGYQGTMLSRIEASDGRKIIITPEAGNASTRIASITVVDPNDSSKNRTWYYNYATAAQYDFQSLKTVTRPDNKSWQFNLEPISWLSAPHVDHALDNCSLKTSGVLTQASIVHPDGVTGTFKVRPKRHGRTNVKYLANIDASIIKSYKCFYTNALVEKQLSGGGINYKWRYHYSENEGTYDTEVANGTVDASRVDLNLSNFPAQIDARDYKYTQVTLPNGSVTRHFFNRDYTSYIEQQEVATQYIGKDGSSLLRESSRTYDESSPVHIGYADIPNENLKPDNHRLNDLSKTIKEFYKDGSTQIYSNVYSNHDLYGVPSLISQQGTHSKHTKQAYTHDKRDTLDAVNGGLWELHLPTITEVSSDQVNYTTIKELTYKDFTGTHFGSGYSVKVADTQLEFGNWQHKASEYHSDGNIKTIEHNELLLSGSKNRYQSYNNYQRGTAQTINLPNSLSSGSIKTSQIVDINGWVTSTMDFEENAIGYGYNGIGRLAYIDPNDVDVSDTVINWSYDGGASGKQPVRTEKRCTLNSSKTACSDTPLLTTTTTYDGLLRPALTDTYDGVSRTYVRRTFNSDNKVTFESFPSSVANEPSGTTYVYDGLGRLEQVSVTSGGKTEYEYLSGNRIKVTDAENNETTTTYLAYGQPMYEQATKIESPEGVTTDINIDVFGNIQSIRQHASGTYPVDQTEYRAYDSQKRLCQISRSDVGTTVFNRNNLGEIKWMAEGQTAVSTNVCNTTASDTDKVTYTYDNLGQQYTISYGDSTPTRTYSYDNNGNVKTISNGVYTQSYNYNSLNLVEDESLAIDGHTFRLDYEYTPLGHLDALTYPGGELAKVDFATNGFGQATQAIRVNSGADDEVFVKGGSSRAEYHPNGVIESFTYGNGVAHSTSLNSRNLPRQITDLTSDKAHVNLTYGYDNNLNITSIANPKDGGIYGLSLLQYDGLDRLINTTGDTGIGSSTIAYDGLGNIRAYKNTSLFDPSDLTYSYDNASNRLMSVSNSELSEDSDDGQRNFGASGYDARGNVLKNGKRSFTYNRANQMIGSGTNSLEDTSLFEYDGHNRRIKYQKDDGKIEYSMYSQSGKLLYRQTEQGYTNFIFLGDKLVAKEGTGLAESSDDSNGDMNYKPFGDSVEPPKDDVGYTGHKFDTELGLSYMQARYYDPVIGRFYSNDPVGTLEHLGGLQGIQGFNRYAYANNNPYKYTDPDGKSAQNLGIWIGGFIETGSVEGANKVLANAIGAQKTMLKEAASLTRAGLAVDVAEVTSDVINDKDTSSKLKGMGAGEMTKKAVETTLEKKLGKEGAEVVGTIAGKAVGDTVENISETKVEADGVSGADSKGKFDKD